MYLPSILQRPRLKNLRVEHKKGIQFMFESGHKNTLRFLFDVLFTWFNFKLFRDPNGRRTDGLVCSTSRSCLTYWLDAVLYTPSTLTSSTVVERWSRDPSTEVLDCRTSVFWVPTPYFPQKGFIFLKRLTRVLLLFLSCRRHTLIQYHLTL